MHLTLFWICLLYTSGEKRGKNDNKRYWRKLKQISNDEAHQISRQIIDFCVETGAGVILLPKYSKEFTKYVMAAVGNWSPLHLNYQIRSQLKYKAWQAGILILESEVHDIDRYCALCGGMAVSYTHLDVYKRQLFHLL